MDGTLARTRPFAHTWLREVCKRRRFENPGSWRGHARYASLQSASTNRLGLSVAKPAAMSSVSLNVVCALNPRSQIR